MIRVLYTDIYSNSTFWSRSSIGCPWMTTPAAWRSTTRRKKRSWERQNRTKTGASLKEIGCSMFVCVFVRWFVCFAGPLYYYTWNSRVMSNAKCEANSKPYPGGKLALLSIWRPILAVLPVQTMTLDLVVSVSYIHVGPLQHLLHL